MNKDPLICPNCSSTKTVPYWGNAWDVDTGLYTQYRKCLNCGYVGKLFTKQGDDLPYELERPKPKRRIKLPKLNLVDYILLLVVLIFIIFLFLL